MPRYRRNYANLQRRYTRGERLNRADYVALMAWRRRNAPRHAYSWNRRRAVTVRNQRLRQRRWQRRGALTFTRHNRDLARQIMRYL